MEFFDLFWKFWNSYVSFFCLIGGWGSDTKRDTISC